jgi:hypothetical protein
MLLARFALGRSTQPWRGHARLVLFGALTVGACRAPLPPLQRRAAGRTLSLRAAHRRARTWLQWVLGRRRLLEPCLLRPTACGSSIGGFRASSSSCLRCESRAAARFRARLEILSLVDELGTLALRRSGCSLRTWRRCALVLLGAIQGVGPFHVDIVPCAEWTVARARPWGRCRLEAGRYVLLRTVLWLS